MQHKKEERGRKRKKKKEKEKEKIRTKRVKSARYGRTNANRA